MIDNPSTVAARRKSLLPQLSSTKNTSTRMRSIVEQPAKDKTMRKTPTTEIGSLGLSQSPSDKLPHSSLGRSRSMQDSARPASLRRPSTSKLPSREPSCGSATLSTQHESQEAQVGARTAHHGRSVSHQKDRKTMVRAPSSKLAVKPRLSTRSPRPASASMQQTYPSKKTTSSRPTSPSRRAASEEASPSIDCHHDQMELAQLHLLHRSAHVVQHQWERSAQDSFRKRFATLSERHRELGEIASQQQALIDQLALVQWSQNQSGTQLGEKIALFSRNVADVCSLIDTEGEYTRILDDFESWFAQTLQAREKRKPQSDPGEGPLQPIEGIGDGWRAETMVLERELTYCLHDLKAFGAARSDSSLGPLQLLYTKLVLNLIEELDVVQWIENRMMVQETSWIESTIHRLALDVESDINSIAKA